VKYVTKTWRVSLSIGIRITMIRCVVYLFQIFKMFHGLMNNPIYDKTCFGSVRLLVCFINVRGFNLPKTKIKYSPEGPSPGHL
jgi:hypothetical protein